jgi:hypothetical protein
MQLCSTNSAFDNKALGLDENTGHLLKLFGYRVRYV